MNSRRECLEISGIPAEVGHKDIEKNVLEVLDAIETPVNTDLVEHCSCIPSKGSPKKSYFKTKPTERPVLLNKKKVK